AISSTWWALTPLYVCPRIRSAAARTFWVSRSAVIFFSAQHSNVSRATSVIISRRYPPVRIVRTKRAGRVSGIVVTKVRPSSFSMKRLTRTCAFAISTSTPHLTLNAHERVVLGVAASGDTAFGPHHRQGAGASHAHLTFEPRPSSSRSAANALLQLLLHFRAFQEGVQFLVIQLDCIAPSH